MHFSARTWWTNVSFVTLKNFFMTKETTGRLAFENGLLPHLELYSSWIAFLVHVLSELYWVFQTSPIRDIQK